ncbi:MAG TPA: transglycosylase SLT domain-containing protein, partial [Burkholderiales bacterium]|nr:transglycosylase SLT domain-containing protein [Burkholderiales bacterium]
MIAVLRNGFWMAALLAASVAHAGNQRYEPLSASVRAALSKTVSDSPVSNVVFFEDATDQAWLNEMSRRLASRMPDSEQRIAFLNTVHYEAARAGLDAGLVLGLIEVESGFKKYAVSSTAARGYMQVMPFWVNMIG